MLVVGLHLLYHIISAHSPLVIYKLNENRDEELQDKHKKMYALIIHTIHVFRQNLIKLVRIHSAIAVAIGSKLTRDLLNYCDCVNNSLGNGLNCTNCIGGSWGCARDAPLVQLLSFSCSCQIIGFSPYSEADVPRLGNPGTATEVGVVTLAIAPTIMIKMQERVHTIIRAIAVVQQIAGVTGPLGLKAQSS